ncbi:MAG TPA: hypothetical protein VNP37_18690, partial [Actinomycetospora sp.]|nr:hypothetical protein [Actinomycetospora sp.]
GGPALGWLAEEFGGRAPLVLGGAASVVAALAAGLWVVLRRRREGRGEGDQPPGQSWTGSLASMPSR